MAAGKTTIENEAGIAGSTSGDSYLDKQISTFSTQITDVTTRMNAEETQYYSQFDAMETALQKLSQQSSWLASQLGTSSSSSSSSSSG